MSLVHQRGEFADEVNGLPDHTSRAVAIRPFQRVANFATGCERPALLRDGKGGTGYYWNRSSTRLLAVRPSSVLLDAMGSFMPYPRAVIKSLFTPLLTR